MPERTREALGVAAVLLIGVAAFFAFAGWWVLIPDNIAWLDVRDRAMHTLGWMFYRDAPWGVPPGDNPHLGIELASSIGLVDGLPLFAVPLKLVAGWLPRPFQYWGYWWLLCFMLQAFFAFRLARALNAARPIAVLAGAFAVIAPAFLFRLPLHMALAGHWTLLAALWLYARPAPPRWWAWPLLLGLTASIHAYLFVMAGGIWFAAWVQRMWLRRLPGGNLVGEPVGILVLSGLVLWTAGFFYTGTLGGPGYGYFRLNLLGPILTQGWSHLIPSLPHSDYDYEGLSFPGIGIYAALLIALFTGALAALRKLFTPRWLPLVVLGLLFCVFALSNVLGVFNRETAPIPVPGLVEYLGNTFRSTGRFVWPLLYLSTIGIVVLAARRLPVPVAAILLTAAFALQIWDTSWYWSSFRRAMPEPGTNWPTPLTSAVWDRAPVAGYTRVRTMPIVFHTRDWKWLEYYAGTHHMDIDAIYLGRVDTNAVGRVAATDAAAVAAGTLEPHTLYLVDLRTARAIAPTLRPDDLLATVDQRLLYARGGAALVEGLGIDPQGGTRATAWLPESRFPTTSP